MGVRFGTGWYDPPRQGFAVGVHAIGTIGPAIALLAVPRTLTNYGQAYVGWGMAILLAVDAVAAWLVFAVWPFSRLVHAWSIPFQYVGRPYILYRRRWAPARRDGRQPHRR